MIRRGLRNRSGKPISKTGLSIMLNNPFYMGLIRLRRTKETFKGAHTAIVSPSLFKHVQAVLSGKLSARVQKHSFLFRRLFRCGACGYTLIGERQKGHIYYRCHTRDCATTGVREEAAAEVVLGLFSHAQLTPEELDGLRTLVPQVVAEESVNRDKRLRTADLQLASHKARLDRLTDAYIDQVIDKAAFEERRARLLIEQAALEEQMAEIRNSKDTRKEKTEKILELAGSLYSSYILACDPEKRNILEEATSNRQLCGKNIAITLKSPFAEMANRTKTANGGPLRDELRTLAVLIASLAK